MAKTKRKTQLVAVPDDESKEIAAYLEETGAAKGTENFDKSDVTIPRIKIAQDLTKEVKDNLLEVGDLFLNISGQRLAAYGEPLEIIPIAVSKEFIMWPDETEGLSGPLARAKLTILEDNTRVYAWDKPGITVEVNVGGVSKQKYSLGETITPEQGLDAWGSKIKGDKESGKAATVHHNYIVVLPEHDNMICAFSLSRTQVKRARAFNALLDTGSLPIYVRKYIVYTDTETGGKFTWPNVRFKPNGRVTELEAVKFFKGIADGFATEDWVVADQAEATEEGEF